VEYADKHKDKSLVLWKPSAADGTALGQTPAPIQVLHSTDAAYGNREELRSTTGSATYLGGGGAFIVKTKEQKNMANSSSVAELAALNSTLVYPLATKNILEWITDVEQPAAIVEQDNQSTLHMAARGRSNSNRTRHLHIRWFWVKDQVDNKQIKLIYTPTGEISADFFTKAKQGADFKRLVDRIMFGEL